MNRLERGLISTLLGAGLVLLPAKSTYAQTIEQFSWSDVKEDEVEAGEGYLPAGDYTGARYTSSGKGCNNCVGRSANKAISAAIERDLQEPNSNPELSEQEYICEGIVDCERGGQSTSALNYARDFGVVDSECLPYRGNYMNNCDLCDDSDDRRTQIYDWDYIDDENWYTRTPDEAYEILKNAIKEKGVLVNDSMRLPLDENKIIKVDDDGIIRCNGDNSGPKHSVNITGYYYVYNEDGTVNRVECHLLIRTNYPGEDKDTKISLKKDEGSNHIAQCTVLSGVPEYVLLNEPVCPDVNIPEVEEGCEAIPRYDEDDCITKYDIECDYDGDGYNEDVDCDDNDSSKWQSLEGYVDSDDDRYGTGSKVNVCSGNSLTSGYASNANDCDDGDGNIWRLLTGHVDSDGDGYGVGSEVSVCSGNSLTSGYASNANDCDDNHSSKWQSLEGYVDSDRDGYGTGSKVSVCSGNTLAEGYASNADDCDDNNPDLNVDCTVPEPPSTSEGSGGGGCFINSIY